MDKNSRCSSRCIRVEPQDLYPPKSHLSPMKRITKPCLPQEKKYIFTEGINYFKTGKGSIWGPGDKETVDLLKRIDIHGKWLNLAAGDEGYTSNLLEKVDSVVASDIDESALSKLWHNMPLRYRSKLETKVFDMTKKFPFPDNSFDGVFCTGVLHLFPKKILKAIFSEINRVLKPHGKVIIDFPTDIHRTDLDGQPVSFGGEHFYTHQEAKLLLNELFGGYSLAMHDCKVPEYVTGANPPYKYSSNYVLLVADKN